MATYNTAFGSLPGYNEMLGTTNTTGGGQQQTYTPQQPTTTRPPTQAQQTFAQMQRQGMARPAPAAPQAQPMARYAGSEQAGQMRQRLQQQLESFGNQPSRFDTQAFQQIRGAQQANLQSEFQEQQRQLNEDLARRGLSASNIAASGLGRLGGAQARALADIDAQLLQRAAETQAQDRAQLLAAGQGLAELAGAQDLQQFEANRVAQAADFENALRSAQFGQQQYESDAARALQAAQAGQSADQFRQELGLRAGELTGQLGGMQTLAARQQAEAQRQFNMEQGLRQVLGLGGLAEQQAQRQQQSQLALMQATGQVYTINPETGLPELARGAPKTLSAQQQALQERQAAYQQAATMSQITGKQYTVSDMGQVVATESLTPEEQQRAEQNRLAQAELTGQYAGKDTLAARQQSVQQRLEESRLKYQQAAQQSQQSGIQHTVDADGNIVPLRDAQGNPVRTSEVTQAEETRKQQDTLTRLDLNLRRQLGLTEATGQMYNIDPVTGQAVLATGAPQTLAARQFGIQEGTLTGTYGGKLTQAALQDAYQRAAQLSQVTGQQYTVDPNTGAITAGGDTLAARLQQAGITGTFGGALTQSALQDAYARAAQLSQITGQQYTVNEQTGAISPVSGADTLSSQLQRAQLTGTLGGQATLERLQTQLQQAQTLSQITGQQYTVDPATGQLRLSGGFTEAARQANLEAELRRQLGLTEASGYVYDMVSGVPTRTGQETVQGQLARSQLLMSLAQTLSGLAPDQIAQILGQRVTTTTGATGTTSSTSGSGTPVDGTAAGQPPTGGTTYTVGQNYTDKYGYTWTKTSTGWSLKSAPSTSGTTTTTTGEVNKPPTNATEGQIWTDATGRTYRFTNGQWVLQTTTTTTQGGTTTTQGGTTTTTPSTSTTGTAAPSLIGSVLTSTYPYATNGLYAEVGTQGGSTWYQYQNGQWVTATQPTVKTTTDPTGSFQMNVYPGTVMTGANNQRYYWDGSKWMLIPTSA